MRLTNSNKSSVLFASAAFVSALGLPGVTMASDGQSCVVLAARCVLKKRGAVRLANAIIFFNIDNDTACISIFADYKISKNRTI